MAPMESGVAGGRPGAVEMGKEEDRRGPVRQAGEDHLVRVAPGGRGLRHLGGGPGVPVPAEEQAADVVQREGEAAARQRRRVAGVEARSRGPAVRSADTNDVDSTSAVPVEITASPPRARRPRPRRPPGRGHPRPAARPRSGPTSRTSEGASRPMGVPDGTAQANREGESPSSAEEVLGPAPLLEVPRHGPRGHGFIDRSRRTQPAQHEVRVRRDASGARPCLGALLAEPQDLAERVDRVRPHAGPPVQRLAAEPGLAGARLRCGAVVHAQEGGSGRLARSSSGMMASPWAETPSAATSGTPAAAADGLLGGRAERLDAEAPDLPRHPARPCRSSVAMPYSRKRRAQDLAVLGEDHRLAARGADVEADEVHGPVVESAYSASWMRRSEEHGVLGDSTSS